MAARFWVGNGTWDGVSTANWSATSGGATGASVPTSADTVTFDANSGSCTISGSLSCLSLTVGTGSVNGLNGGSFDSINIYGTTGTILALTPGAAGGLTNVFINVQATSGSVNITVNLSGVAAASGALKLGAGGASTATYTLLTSGNFYSTVPASGLGIEVYNGTFSTGTVSPTFQFLYVFNGTFNANASAISYYEVFSIAPYLTTDAVTATLGTSTITATGSGTRRIELGRADFQGTTTITTGATQTLNAIQIDLYPTVTATLRTIVASNALNITLPSGVNLTAGAVTCNGICSVTLSAGISTLPTLTLTSYTGSSSVNAVMFELVGPAFTCGAITLTQTGGGGLIYKEQSQGAVNVTGAITTTSSTNAYAGSIWIASQAAFSGTPSVNYAALTANATASASSTIRIEAARPVIAGAITATEFQVFSSATVGAVTLGSVATNTYDGVFQIYNIFSLNFTATSFAAGAGAVISSFRTNNTGQFTVTSTISTTELYLANHSVVNIAGNVTVVNNTANAGFLDISGCATVTLAGFAVSGTVYTSGNYIAFGNSSAPNGSFTLSGTLTTGSAATNRLPVLMNCTGNINFSSTTATHAIQKLRIERAGTSIAFGAGSSLALNLGTLGDFIPFDNNPLYINSDSSTTSVTLRTVTCDYTDITRSFFIFTPAAAITFSNSPTMGAATATRCNLVVNGLSFACPAIETSGYRVETSAGVAQSGTITISGTAISSPSLAVNITAGASSTIAGITLASITDTSTGYNVSLNGAGPFTISSTIVGPTAPGVDSSILANCSSTTTFSGAISNFTRFTNLQGNLVFTGALAITIRNQVYFAAGYSITPNTSVITIDGTSTLSPGIAELDHGGYTLNSVIFSATASRQYVANTTSSSGLTVGAFTSNGAAVPYSFLILKTDVNVTASQLTIAPNSITNRHLVCSDAIGTPRTLTAATRTINAGADFQDITAAGATPWNLSAISVGDAGGNLNITFSTPVTRTLAVTTGSVNWDATATWTGAVVPLAHDIADISAGTASLTINTNNRAYLGNITFGSFAGSITVNNVFNGLTIATVNTLNSIDLSNVTGSYTTARLTFISRGTVTFSPPASSAVFGPGLEVINTGSLTMAGANDLVLGARDLDISSASFNTNTGSRICNISAQSLNIGGIAGSFTSAYNSATASNLNSSIISSTSILTLRNCSGTTATITSSDQIRIEDSVNFTNATITPTTDLNFWLGVSASNNITLGSSTISAANVYFNAGFTFNSASATINVTQGVFQTSSSSATWVEGTTQVNFTGTMPNASLAFEFNGNLTASTVHRVTINDTASTLGATTEIFLSGTSTNPAIRFFDASAMRRPLRLGSQQLYGGLNAVFSNKAYTYLRTPSQYRIVGSDPLYIPYAFCYGANVVSGSIVAYGPANLGSNVGNITFPSRLRYYAFVDTATSMTVPNDYNGMGLLLAIGGGATPSSVASVGFGKGGGGGGTISYTFLLSPNNLSAPVVAGQTIFISAGSYAVAPVANTVGGNGNISWANLSANVAPTTALQGVLANGGSTTSSSFGGSSSTSGAVGHLLIPGGAGSNSSASNGSGGGGGSARFSAFGVSATNIAAGGAGTTSSNLTTGQGGSGSVAGGAAGTAGLTPTAGANGSSSTGAGGGGGGGNTYNPGTTTTTNVTRASGSTTMVFNVTSHGFVAGDRIVITSSPTAQKTGTWSKSSSLITASVTVNITNHGLVAGNLFYFSRTSGSIVPSGTYTVATAATNSFTFVPSVTGTSSGNCTLGQAGLTSGSNYAVTVNTPDQFQVTGTVSTILSSGQYSYIYRPVYIRPEYRGANGGSGALNSAENFIRYYNNAYTPGYFGIGGAGGGGGNIQFVLSNLGNSGGNGGDGGIGAGGGGIGVAGNLVPTPISSVATSGRGGPGMVMFIYALRANNLSLIQGT